MKRRAALLACTLGSGCYQQLYDAVVDKSDTSPGGTITTLLGGQQVGDTTGLAKSTSSTSMDIEGLSKDASLLISMTAGLDTTGVEARDALGVAGASVTLVITPTGDSALQLHYIGSTCAAATGQIDLQADTNLALTGAFMADGTDDATGAACSVTGTITTIPQQRP